MKPAKFAALVSNGGSGKIIAGILAGRVGVLSGAPLGGMMIVVVGISGSVCVPVGVVVGMDVNWRLETVMNEN